MEITETNIHLNDLHRKPDPRTAWRARLGVAAFNKAENAHMVASHLSPDVHSARVWLHLARIYEGIQRRCGL